MKNDILPKKSNLGHFWRYVSSKTSQNERILIKNDLPPKKAILAIFDAPIPCLCSPYLKRDFYSAFLLKRYVRSADQEMKIVQKTRKKQLFVAQFFIFLGPQSAENVVFQNSLAKLVEKYLWTSEVRKMMTQKFGEKKDHGLAYISFSSIFVEGERE